MKHIGVLWFDEIDGRTAIGVGEPVQLVSPAAATIRERVRHGDDGRYRPLSAARGLPTRWFAATTPEITEEAVVEAVYPLATVHRRQFDAGTLRVVGLDEVLRRQSGRYEEASALSSRGRVLAQEVLCHSICVRSPVWAGAEPGSHEIPCPEPCSVLVALAREAALWEREPPEPAEPAPAVAFADFETSGNEVREAYLVRARQENA